MKFLLERKYLKPTYTIGNLYVDHEDGKGRLLVCNILEPQVRDFNKDGDLDDKGEGKIEGKTAIPYGKYSLSIVMSPMFKKHVPLINGTRGFTAVEIHPGNDENDTRACLLPGYNLSVGKVLHSTECFQKIMGLLNDSGQKSWEITIV